MSSRRWLRSGLLLALLPLLVLLVLYFRPRSQLPSLNLGLAGCWELTLHADGHTVTCWLDPLDPVREQHIRVLVRETASADLSVTCKDCQPAACSAEAGPVPAASATANADCRDLLPGSKPHQQAVLRLTTPEQTLGESTIEIIVPELTPMDKLRQSWRATKGKLAALQHFLPEAQDFLVAQPPGERHDRAEILLARVYYDKLRAMDNETVAVSEPEAAEVRAVLQRALAVAQEKKWIGSAADLSEELAWFYRYRDGAVANIDALLARQSWPPLLPTSKIEVYRWLVGAALDQHDLRHVETYVSDALADADALRDAALFRSMVELRTKHIEQLALTSSQKDVAKGLKELQALAAKAARYCDQAYIWGSLGWTQLQLWELGWPLAQNPAPALERARELREKHCPGQGGRALANVWMNLARARSARWHTAKLDSQSIDDEIAAVRQALSKMTIALGDSPLRDGERIDLLLVEARLHLLQKKPVPALASLQTLMAIGTLSRSPIQRWLATVHQAEAEEAAGQLDGALATFRKAETLLVDLQGHVPIYQSHRLMLERYEYSSQSAVALALRLQRPDQAVEIIRQASQRALGLTMTPWWSTDAQPGDPRWEQRRQQQTDYLARRSLYETDLTHVTVMTQAECQELGVKKQHWLGAMDSLFRYPAPALFVPPPIPPDELLITCAQQRVGWVCLGTLNGTAKVVTIAGALDRSAVETHLLPELAEQIHRAVKIRVLAAGALAQLNLAAMQFDGSPLGTHKPIRFTLDRPPVLTVQPLHQALLVIKPEQSIAGLSIESAYRQVAPALQRLNVVARSVTSNLQAPLSWHLGTATGAEVLADLPLSEVFIFFGHVNPMPCPTQSQLCSFAGDSPLEPDRRLTAMCLGQHTALSTADLLVARKVPRRAVLLGCASTDRSDTAPSEMLGLAQAMALRGAQVLALAKPFLSDQAQEVLCALGQKQPDQKQLDQPDFDMDVFVMDTQRHLHQGDRCTAQGKWHTPSDPQKASPNIDWSAIRSYGP